MQGRSSAIDLWSFGLSSDPDNTLLLVLSFPLLISFCSPQPIIDYYTDTLYFLQGVQLGTHGSLPPVSSSQ